MCLMPEMFIFILKQVVTGLTIFSLKNFVMCTSAYLLSSVEHSQPQTFRAY